MSLPSARRTLPWLVAITGTVVFHRYTILSGFDMVQADNGDSRYIAFMLEHWNAVLHGQARIGSPLIFWPVLGTLGYSDALAAMGAVHVALRAMGLPVFTAMNVQLVLLTLASFWAAHLFFVRGFRLGTVAATVGAAFFAFSWPRFAALVHPQMEFTFELPLLALLALECLRDGPGLSRRGFAWRVAGFVMLLAVTMATTVYYAEFAALFLLLTVLPTLFVPSALRHYALIVRRHWAALLGGVLLAALLAWPIARIYLPILRQSGGRPWDLVETQLLDPVDLLWMGRENYVWGWLFARWHDRTLLNWPDTRIGVGLIASVAWLAASAWAVSRIVQRRRVGLDKAIASVAILAACVVELLAMRFHGQSLWWLVFEGFPGMAGLRTVARIGLVATLLMGLGFAFLIEHVPRRWGPVMAVMVGLAAIEQLGAVQLYSARDAEAVSRRVSDAIPRTCASAYIMGTTDMLPRPPPITDEAQFDPAAYLRANPDVAAAWGATPWEHYVRFGRREERWLDARQARHHRAMMFFYNYTIPLGATLAGIPVVNGLSGWRPPNWELDDVFAPAAPQKLAAWMTLNHRDPAGVCQVRIDMPYNSLPTIELWDE